MKLGALIQGAEVPSSRYRILQYFPGLEQSGFACEARPFPEGGWRETLAWVRGLDLLWLHRKRPNALRLLQLRRAAKRIVYDVDDAVMYRDTLSLGRQESASRRRRFAATVKAADLVIVGNRYLERHAREHTDAVSVLPTAIDLSLYAERTWEPRPGPRVLGWIGDTGSVAYLERQRSLFDAIGKACPGLVFRVISSRFPRYEHLKVEEVRWRSEIEAETLRSFDIGVMPLPDDPWSKGKCALKLLQYMASGVPAVASPVGMNADVVRHGENSFAPTTAEGWTKAIRTLAADPALRERMGRAGRRTVAEGYALSVMVPRLAAILRAVAAGMRPA
jgi:glycosyltransferase involved in cell wall biosynthesis